MLCPKCGAQMQPGEAAHYRGESAFWAPKAFFQKHSVNPCVHRAKTIEREGGIMIPLRRRMLSAPRTAYACPSCRLVVLDCN